MAHKINVRYRTLDIGEKGGKYLQLIYINNKLAEAKIKKYKEYKRSN